MCNIFNVFDCKNCGETINVSIVEDIDCDNDEVYEVPICNKCHSEVSQRWHQDKDGKRIPVMKEVDDDTARWMNGFYDDF